MDRTEARAVLGVGATASPAVRDEAFRRLARDAHPDRGGDPDEFERLVRARDVLRGGRPNPNPAPVQARSGRATVVPDVPFWKRLLDALGRRPPPRGRVT